jgi:hypothetical protein
MNANPKQYIESEILSPTVKKLHKLLHYKRIDAGNRIEIGLQKWDVIYHGVFEHGSNTPPTPVRSVTYMKINLSLSIQVDGIVVAIKQFEFAQSLKDVIGFEDALEGTAFGLYEVVEPVLEHGFCPGCNRPFQRDANDKLTCTCIERTEADAKL